MPKISICVPAYKNPSGIARLLASVKAQTYEDYEVILTDDTPDESVRDAAMAAEIPNLRYEKNRIRQGAANNWNASVRLARGEWIKMMHHDDWFASPASLERMADLLESDPAADLAFCGTWQVTLGEGVERGTEPAAPCSGDAACGTDRFPRGISREQEELIRADYRNLFLGNYIGSPSATLYRKTGLEYEPALTWLVDMEYYMRLLARNPRFACTAEPLICIGVSESQLTERCRTDGELNLYEYGFLFREFDLKSEERFCEKLVQIGLKYGQPWEKIEPYGVSRALWKEMARRKRMGDLGALAKAAGRKLLRRG